MISLRDLLNIESTQTAGLRELVTWLADDSSSSLLSASIALRLRAPKYEPEKWNDGGVVQSCNNCYAYACDIKTDDLAQPGFRSFGGASPRTHQEIVARAEADGLRRLSGPQCHPYEHLVAVAMGTIAEDLPVDVHWFRMDRGGTWSHKRGNTEAKQLVNGSTPIGPEEFQPTVYRFLDYFAVHKPSARIKGPGCGAAEQSLKQDSVDVGALSAEPGPPKVTLDLYSGRPNPSWSLSSPQVEELRRLIERSNAERCDTATQPPYLGYAGFVISNPEGVTGLPYELRVYGGMLRATEQLGERALVEAGSEQTYCAQAHALEAWLMEQAKQLGYAEAIERMGGPRT